jgi:hypothetical protein
MPFNRVPIMTREFITMTGSLRGQPSILPSLPGNYTLFMQNKPNFLEIQMNLNPDITKHYKQKPPLRPPPKQSQFKPNQTQFRAWLATGEVSSPGGYCLGLQQGIKPNFTNTTITRYERNLH